jgi:hypothetical protein
MTRSTAPVLPCMCASLRRASRTITQVYEQALIPAGLSATQFTIMQTLSLAGEVTQGELARILAMDSEEAWPRPPGMANARVRRR